MESAGDIKFDSKSLEKIIVSYCIKNKSFFLKVGKHLRTASAKKKSYFNDAKFQSILNMVCYFNEKYEKFPTLEEIDVFIDRTGEEPELKLFLKKTAEDIYEFDINEIDTKFVEEETISFIKSARVVEAMGYSQLDLEKGNFPSIVERMKEAVNINFDKDLGLSVKDLAEGLSVLREAEDETRSISLGWNCMDDVFGRIRPGELFVFAGVPGIGKTIWLGSVAMNNFLQGKNVVVITLETSPKRLLSRYYQSLFHKSKTQLITDDIDVETVGNLLPETGDVIIKQFGANTASASDMSAFMSDLVMYKNFKPDLVIVDYILITKTNSDDISAENTYKYYKKVTEELRNLGVEWEVPVITAAQINREGMGETGGSKAVVTSKSGSESRGILDTADYYSVIVQTSQDKKKFGEGIGAYSIYVDKNRNDKTGIRMNFYIDYSTFSIKEGTPK